MTKVTKETLKKFWAAMIVYTIAIFAMSWVDHGVEGSALHFVLTILPSIPVAYAGMVMFKGVMKMDELVRRVHMEAIVFSSFVTAFVTFAWSLLSNAGVPELPAIWVLPMLIAFWGVGLFWRKRKYE